MPKKILVINDIPGAGKVAGNINLPLFAAGRFESSILPTLILSKNTDFDQGEVVRHSLGEDFQAMMDHWQQAAIDFEVYTTGFFNSIDQIHRFGAYFDRCLDKNPHSRLYIDPIMGDHGSLYPGFNPHIPQVIGDLCQDAYVIVPNLTEACLITGFEYKEKMTDEELAELSQALVKLGVENVVLTGIEGQEEEEQIGFFYYSGPDQYEKVLHKKYPYHFFGTGDMAMSLIIICHVWGLSLRESLQQTGHWIEKALESTIQLNRSFQEGVFFESIILDVAQFAYDQAQKENKND